jgi:hypothetical protein
MERDAPAGAAPVQQLSVASRKLREALGALEELPEGAQDQVADLVRALRDSFRWGMVRNPATNLPSHRYAPLQPCHTMAANCMTHALHSCD